MKKANVIDLAHNILLKHIKPHMTIVDATCGNGHDTLFLASRVGHVHAFDIQQEALDNTRSLTKDLDNITYHHTSHEHITKLISNYDGVIFNLGYLPKGDKSITTHHTSTVNTLKSLHEKHQGFVLIVAYPGHTEGIIEQVALQSFLDKQDIKYEVIRLPHITKKDAPLIYFYTY